MNYQSIRRHPITRAVLDGPSQLKASHSPARLDRLPHNARIECTGLDRTGKKHRSCQLHTVFPEMDETVLPARNRALRYESRKYRCYIHTRYSITHVFLTCDPATPFALPSRWCQSSSLPYRLRSACH